MTAPHPDPLPDAAEADLLEQQAPVDPPHDTDREAPVGSGPSVPSGVDSAPLADRLEQLEDVPSQDDEDYPYDV